MEQQLGVPEREVSSRFKDLVKMLRFYAVLRRYGYIDPLVYALDVDQVRDTLLQALREYKSYVDGSVLREVKYKCGKDYKQGPLRCLIIYKVGNGEDADLPREYAGLFPDIIHSLVKSEDDKNSCIAPIVCIGGEARPALPSDEQLSEFMELINNGGLRYARALAMLALAR